MANLQPVLLDNNQTSETFSNSSKGNCYISYSQSSDDASSSSIDDSHTTTELIATDSNFLSEYYDYNAKKTKEFCEQYTRELEPGHVEERFKVDRKKLERMLQPVSNDVDDCSLESGEDFFHRIMDETDTTISWPSRLKIGAKSKKDPHIKVTGKPEKVASAKNKIMSILDTKSNRVTLKMDVSYTEHSHIIGKGGNNIRKVMEDTGCHIHFPDSNRCTQQEKSNQVSIAGQLVGAEQARAKIRELLPLVMYFELPTSAGATLPDMNSPAVQHIVKTCNVAVNMKQKNRGCTTTITVRGAASNPLGVNEACIKLMEHLTGNVGVSLPVSTQLEIAPQHHQFMLARGGLSINHIMQCTRTTIHFPDPATAVRKSSVYITGSVSSVIVARELLMGCLPLVLMFDVREDTDVTPANLSKVMEQFDVFVSVKPKPKQPSKSVIVKSVERNAAGMYKARLKLLGQEYECFNGHSKNGVSVHPSSAVGMMSVVMGHGMPPVMLQPPVMNPFMLAQTGATQVQPHQPFIRTPSPGVHSQRLPSPMTVIPTQCQSPATLVYNIPKNDTMYQQRILSPHVMNLATNDDALTQSPAQHLQGSMFNKMQSRMVQGDDRPQLTLTHGEASCHGEVSQEVPSNHHMLAKEISVATNQSSVQRIVCSSNNSSRTHGEVSPQVEPVQNSTTLSIPVSQSFEQRTLYCLTPPSIAPTPALRIAPQMPHAYEVSSTHQAPRTHQVPMTNQLPPNHLVLPSQVPAPHQVPPNHQAPPTSRVPPSHQVPPPSCHVPTTHHMPSTLNFPLKAQVSAHGVPTEDGTVYSMIPPTRVNGIEEMAVPTRQNGVQQRLVKNVPPGHMLPHGSVSGVMVQPLTSLTDTTSGESGVKMEGAGLLRTSAPQDVGTAVSMDRAPFSDQTNASISGYTCDIVVNSHNSSALLAPQLPKSSDIHVRKFDHNRQPFPETLSLGSSCSKDTVPAPPPGFSTPNPAMVSSQLVQLRLSNGLKEDLKHSSGPGNRLKTSSPSGSSSPDIPEMANSSMTQKEMYRPSRSLSSQDTSSDSSDHFSPSNSGHFSPSNSGYFSPSNSGHFSPSNSGGYTSLRNSGLCTNNDTLYQSGTQRTASDRLAYLLGDRSSRSMSQGSSESEADSESSDKRAPGWERTEKHKEMVKLEAELMNLDYDQKKLLAQKAMKNLPVTKEVRTPIDTWSGLGFSKSMPDSHLREIKKKNGFSLCLPSTYEHDEAVLQNPSDPCNQAENNNTMNHAASISKNRSKQPKKQGPLMSCSNYIDSTTLPRKTMGLWTRDSDTTPSAEQNLSDVFVDLGLAKYTDVFQQQEIDLATFLTLTDIDLRELGVSTFGARRKMLLAISDLNNNGEGFLKSPLPARDKIALLGSSSGPVNTLGRNSPMLCW